MAKSPFRLRAVGLDNLADQALLNELQLKCLPSDTPADTTRGFWWVAFEGDRPAGFCGLYQTHQVEGYLCRAGVLPASRGKGLQRRLIAVRERRARRLGMQVLISDTFLNPPSSNNLIASGFRMYDPAHPWGFRAACYWKKTLT